MDAIAQLALMHKAQKVFGSDSTFLSFPVTPLQYTQAELSFVQDLNVPRLKEFSLLVNLIPTGDAWQPTEAEYLWDVYGDVLGGHDTELAQSTRSPQEEAQYQAAVQFLNSKRDDGWLEPSPALRLYSQFRDQWFVLQERYATAKLTGETATNLEIKTHWQTLEEPQLRQQISDLETRWVNEGFKQEVEQAQQVRNRLGGKNPNKTWGEWNEKFNPDINALTDVDNVQFYPSSFSPINALESGSWQPFTLAKDEVEAMVRAAPAELRSRLAADRQDSDIASISLEFSSAAILRTWLDSDLFKARFWRFSDGSKQLSDGKMPASGRCPAYVTAVVFARNITIKRATPPANSGTPQGPGRVLPNKLPLTAERLEFSKAVQVLKVRPNPQVVSTKPLTHQLGQPALGQPAPAVRQNFQVASIKPNLTQVNFVQAAPASSFKTAQISALQGINISKPLRVNPNPPIAINQLATPTAQILQQEATSKAFRRLQQEAIFRPTLPQAPDSSQTPDASVKPSETTTAPDQIYVLAFICKALPPSPNPDLTLPW
ncbi:hypothetical protein [Pseudanabaena sp. FACHB-2040]|uniref:hypothetical protein n=1 Tax=Pseudanabaena sp. FACHB-2040 TaxID=2692859 RepID=UPI0016841B35|nr:hypothetical protein [Pseudanabaena sp. FACHB-2040]MBD2258597.1 hypothetical protein [Pseudanabaena sp. FACHB-2040]